MSEERILTERDINEFDELFSKELTKDEYQVLQARLEADEIFKYKLVLYRSLIGEIRREGANNQILKQRFQQLELNEKNKKRKRFAWLSVSIAACFAIVVGAALQFHFWSNTSSLDVYNEYKMSEPGLPLLMAKTDLRLLDSAMVAYTGKQYGKAITMLERAGTSDTIIYYKGVCNEMLDNDRMAETQYRRAIQGTSQFIVHKAKFRLALLYLKGDNEKYRTIIEEISKDNRNPYQQQAIRINHLLGKK